MNNRKSLTKPIVLLAAVGLWLYVHRYPTDRNPTPCEQLTEAVAVDWVMPELCKRVPIEADGGGGGFSPEGFQIMSLRSDCFLQTAIATNNIKLCSQVKPIRSDWFGEGFLDGSGFNEAYCIDQVKLSHGQSQMGVTMSDSGLAPLMHQLGYTEQTLLDAGIDVKHYAFPSETFVWDNYIHKLLWVERGMPRYEQLRQERSNFLDKMDHLHCRPPFGDTAWKFGSALVLIFVTLYAVSDIYSKTRKA